MPSTARGRDRGDLTAWVALLPALLLIVVFFVLPALRLVEISFFPRAPGAVMTRGFTLDNYLRFLGDPFYLGKLWLTARVSFIVALVTLAMAYPLAYVLVRARFAGKGLVIGLAMAPLLTNFIVLVFAWILLLGPNGVVTGWIQSIVGGTVRLLYAEPGVVISLVHVSLPFALIPLVASLAQVPRDLEAAARSLGAGPWRAFFQIVLPLSLPGALAAAFIVVSIVLSGFAFALFVGGDAVLIVPLLIWQAVNASLDWPFAAAMSLVTFAIILLLLAFAMWLVGLTGRRKARA